MKVNLHSHTFYCGHATGTPEEYILRAIENGIEIMGFSEHAPFLFPDGYQSGYRLQMEKAEEYFKTLNQLRSKYKYEIKIHIGFEMEYYPLYFKDMYKNVKELGAEYLILGQHFTGNEHPDGQATSITEKPIWQFNEYVDTVIEGMKTGVFTYLCHPDMINATSDMEQYLAGNKRLCLAAKELDVPLEINFYGIRDNRFYPREDFWKIAGEVGCKVVYGFDSHDTLAAFDGDSIPRADEIVAKYGLQLIEEPKIVTLP